MLIQSGSREILLSHALRLASRAAVDDVRVNLDVVPECHTCSRRMPRRLHEGEAALNRAVKFFTESWTSSTAK